jgi:methylenetetrahydrofolate reductase (NADPH)
MHLLCSFHVESQNPTKNLYSRMDRMKETIQPLFTDVTWGAGGSTATLSMDIALQAHNTGHVANLHMTCTNMAGVDDPKEGIRSALQTAKDGGIRNIVALRGDPAAGQEKWTAAEGGFTCALDLVKFIRAEFGDYFGISVAGYPEGHPNAITEVEDPSTMTPSEAARSSNCEGKTYTCKDEDYKKEMDYLKEKVDAGSGE